MSAAAKAATDNVARIIYYIKVFLKIHLYNYVKFLHD
jgi:hypothetical protein